MKKRLFSVLKYCTAATLVVALVTGLTQTGFSPGKKAEAAGTSSVMGSDNYVTSASIKEGGEYSFGEYNWIAAEDHGNWVVLQSKGVTGGYWPGYTMEKWGNMYYYYGSIDGKDISGYDKKTIELYAAINYAEYTGNKEDDSSGLYLISESECSGYYCQALKEAAANQDSFGAHNGRDAWLGTANGRCAYSVDDYSYGVNSNADQDNSFVVAPAFNLDKSKVTVNSKNEIFPFSASTGIKATQSIQSIKEGESIDLKKVIDKVTYTGGSADGKSAEYTVSCDKGTINGTTYTAPRDVEVGDDTETFTIKSTRNSGWTSSVQVNIAQKYVNVSYNVTTNGGTSAAPSSVQDIDLDKVFDANSSDVFNEVAEKPGWEFVGWNTDPNAHGPLTQLTMNSNKTLYAIFKKDLTVTFIDAGS